MLSVDRGAWPRIGITQYRFHPAHLLIPLLLLAYALIAIRAPYGDYDAIWWNAKALFIAEDQPLEAFTNPLLPHLSYPPLMPIAIGYAWRVFGISQTVVIVIHGLIYAGMLMALARLRWWTFAIAGMATLQFAVMQYADLALALVFLASWMAYRRYGDHVLVGAALGIGLLIKNESTMLTIITLMVVVVDTRRPPLKTVMGLMPAAAALLIFKAFIATEPNDLMSSTGIVERLINGERYRIILDYAGVHLMQWGTAAIPLLLLCAVLQRAHLDRAALLWVLAAAVGYILIYGLTPHDLMWHLETSFSRLALHLFPMFAYSIGTYRKIKTRG